MSVNKRSNEILNFSYILISNNFVYYIDNEAKFIKLNLSNGDIISKIQLDKKYNTALALPASIAKIDDYFYIGFGNGKVIKIDDSGKTYWERSFNDLLRTPLKVNNGNVLILLNSKQKNTI